MNIGLLKENPTRERRVALTPAAVETLVSEGNVVYIEKGAGEASHFSDEEYEKAGGKLVYTADEVFGRSEILLKISPPLETDCERLFENQTLFSFLHLAVAKKNIIERLLEKNIRCFGYELIEDSARNLPILQEMGEIAGLVSVQIAARLLESNHFSNGRGIVLGGITGIPPATVLVLGAGTVGQAAVRMAMGSGAEVVVLDKDLNRLRVIGNRYQYRVVTATTNNYTINKALQFADVVIGAVLIKGERTPHLISEEMVKKMKKGSVIIDVSIDQGGCVATSHPTTIENPTFVMHNVIHYCVPNIPATVARTATFGLTNAFLPFLLEITEKGMERTLKDNVGLARGVCTFDGKCTNEATAKRFDVEFSNITTLTGEEK
jgi:alanine dehydrogenase